MSGSSTTMRRSEIGREDGGQADGGHFSRCGRVVVRIMRPRDSSSSSPREML